MNAGLDAGPRAKVRSGVAPVGRRSRTRTSSMRYLRRASAPLLLVLLACTVAAGVWYVYQLQQRYSAVRADLASLEQSYDLANARSNLKPADLPALAEQLTRLQRDLRRLDDQLDMPVVGDVARRIPRYGATYQAACDLVQLGLDLVTIARDAAEIGAASYSAYQQTGPIHDAARPGPTWLDVLMNHRAEIDVLNARFDDALLRRRALDAEHLPGRAGGILAKTDELLVTSQRLRDEYFPLLGQVEHAFGAHHDARYLVLLDNSLELHQSGGFPGTYALVTVRSGQVVDYQISNIHDLDVRYVQARVASLPAPAPIRTYIGQREWLPHDVNWLADFPSVGRQFVDMYTVAGDPPLVGIVAVESDVVRQMLHAIGPLTVTVEGEQRSIDASNVITTIESFRSLDERHKQVVAAIGNVMLDRLRHADTRTIAAVIDIVRGAADRRDIQVYATDAALQEQVAKRGWDGALVSEFTAASFAMTVSNLTPNKSSGNVVVTSTLTLRGDSPGVTDHVTWTIRLTHAGDSNGDPAYHGHHRTWIALYLPEGAEITSSSRIAAPSRLYSDPREHAYLIELKPGETEQMSVEIALSNAVAAFNLRRQPGLNDMLVRVRSQVPGCDMDESVLLSRDRHIDMRACIVESDALDRDATR